MSYSQSAYANYDACDRQHYETPWEQEDTLVSAYDAGILNQDPLAILIAFEEAETLEH